jgi:hypothetical protein
MNNWRKVSNGFALASLIFLIGYAAAVFLQIEPTKLAYSIAAGVAFIIGFLLHLKALQYEKPLAIECLRESQPDMCHNCEYYDLELGECNATINQIKAINENMGEKEYD